MNKIPNIIHYCWFGETEKPNIVKRCIQSWINTLHGYEIIEWNESNFDITSLPYVYEAYKNKKYAFVSDYVRLWALAEYGGIYLDTDVEVFKKFDDLLKFSLFSGFEEGNLIGTSVIGAEKNNCLIKKYLKEYDKYNFYNKDRSMNLMPNVTRFSQLLQEEGLLLDNSKQIIKGNMCILPKEYLSPYDYINCTYKISEISYCVHHFYVSWMPLKVRTKRKIKKCLVKIIGKNILIKLRTKMKKGYKI